MASAKMESTTIDISSEDSQISLLSTGTVVLFEGFLKVYEEGRDDEVVDDSDKLLPQLSVGDKTDKITITPNQHFTQPQPRYTEATLVKRMEELESIAHGFSGVDQAFAIQAGRELRVMVSAKETDDSKAAKICRDIAKAFEEQLTYPGEIRVTVVRESRFSETAK